MFIRKNNRTHPANKSAFTLIELLVVIVIIGILATLTTVSLTSARAKARDARRVSDLKQISSALELYMADYNAYPTLITPGQVLTSPDGVKTYMNKVPNNPTPRAEGACSDTEYQYFGFGQNYSLVGCTSRASGIAPAGAIVYQSGGQFKNYGAIGGLIGWWLFDEQGGTTVYDSSGYSRNGVVLSEIRLPKATFVQGVGGTALNFLNTGVYATMSGQVVAGMDSAGETNSPYNFNENTSFTLSAWVKYPRRMYGGYSWDYFGTFNMNSFGIVGKVGSINRYGLGIEDSSTIAPSASEGGQNGSFAIRGTVNGGDKAYMARASIGALDTWVHLVGVYDSGSSGSRNIKLYINSDVKASATVASNFVMTMPPGAALKIGSDDSYTQGNRDYFNGVIDDVRIYNRALSQSEIEDIYNATRP